MSTCPNCAELEARLKIAIEALDKGAAVSKKRRASLLWVNQILDRNEEALSRIRSRPS